MSDLWEWLLDAIWYSLDLKKSLVLLGAFLLLLLLGAYFA